MSRLSHCIAIVVMLHAQIPVNTLEDVLAALHGIHGLHIHVGVLNCIDLSIASMQSAYPWVDCARHTCPVPQPGCCLGTLLSSTNLSFKSDSCPCNLLEFALVHLLLAESIGSHPFTVGPACREGIFGLLNLLLDLLVEIVLLLLEGNQVPPEVDDGFARSIS